MTKKDSKIANRIKLAFADFAALYTAGKEAQKNIEKENSVVITFEEFVEKERNEKEPEQFISDCIEVQNTYIKIYGGFSIALFIITLFSFSLITLCLFMILLFKTIVYKYRKCQLIERRFFTIREYLKSYFFKLK